MRHSRGLIAAAQRVINSATGSFQVTNQLKDIVDLFGVGRVVGPTVVFTAAEKGRLRSAISANAQIDPAQGAPEGSRLVVAAVVADEKIAKGGAFGSFVICAGAIPLRSGIVRLPAGTSLNLTDISQIDMATVRHVCVIENGDMMNAWVDIAALAEDDCLSDALFVYRGHQSNAKALRALLRELPPQCEVSFFFDYDPAGILMAHEYATITQCPAFALLPKEGELQRLGAELLKRGNKVDEYNKQIVRNTGVALTLRGPLLDAYDQIKAGRLAITQQFLCANKVLLSRQCI